MGALGNGGSMVLLIFYWAPGARLGIGIGGLGVIGPAPPWFPQHMMISPFGSQTARNTCPQGHAEGCPIPKSWLPAVSATWQPLLDGEASGCASQTYTTAVRSSPLQGPAAQLGFWLGLPVGVLGTPAPVTNSRAPLSDTLCLPAELEDTGGHHKGCSLPACRVHSQHLPGTPSLNPH